MRASFATRWVYALAVVALAIGLYARIAHLDRKLMWQDEVTTAIRVSGHSLGEFYALVDGGIHPYAQIAALLQPAPATPLRLVASIAREDPHHAPLFYVLDRTFVDRLPKPATPATFRTASVVFGILAVGLAFALGRALFESNAGAAMLAGLVAVSPLNVLYSRQAREYALLSCIVLASSVLLVRALERRSAWRWIAYACVLVLGLATDPLFSLVVVAQGITVAWTSLRVRASVAGYLCSAAVAAASAVPWGLNFLRGRGTAGDLLAWGNEAYPPFALAEKWAFNIAAVFFDAEFATLKLAIVGAVVVALVLAAFVIIVRDAPSTRARSLAIPLVVVPIGAFVAGDVATGSHFSTIPRYAFAGWLGVEIVVAAAIVAVCRARPNLAVAAYAFLIACGSFSAIVDNRAVNWWDNNDQVAYQAVAARINQSSAPLIVASSAVVVPLILTYYVRHDSAFMLYDPPATPRLPRGSTAPTYLVIPTALVRDAVERQRPNDVLLNVSPDVRNAISQFHRSVTGRASDDRPPYVQIATPDDALWFLAPKPAR